MRHRTNNQVVLNVKRAAGTDTDTHLLTRRHLPLGHDDTSRAIGDFTLLVLYAYVY
uniref:Uncharacterized protein n=1 Tax=Heterorhabditis bacteriophora TaxID=37862 RepID=A0A1I7WGU5_HETBA